MHEIRKKRLLLILLMVVVSSAAIGAILYALSDSVNYFFPPSEIAAGKAPTDKRIRVGGMVLENSIKRAKDGLRVDFVLTDYKHQLKVSYEGILPDLFAEGEGAVAAGYLQSGGRFVADEVLAKHDETYMPPEVQESLQLPKSKPKSENDQYKAQY